MQSGTRERVASAKFRSESFCVRGSEKANTRGNRSTDYKAILNENIQENEKTYQLLENVEIQAGQPSDYECSQRADSRRKYRTIKRGLITRHSQNPPI